MLLYSQTDVNWKGTNCEYLRLPLTLRVRDSNRKEQTTNPWPSKHLSLIAVDFL